jgi:hypothetical protein
MVFIPPTRIDKETLLRAIRHASRSVAGHPISLHTFLAVSDIRQRDIFKLFPRWHDACRAAGVPSAVCNKPISPALLLADWGSVVGKLRRVPTASEYNVHGRYQITTIVRRFGSWNKIPAAFRAFAADKARWKRIVTFLPPRCLDDPPRGTHPSRTTRNRNRAASPQRSNRARRIPRRPACGDSINFGALRNAPVNEIGVISLFSIMAGQLGFRIEGFQSAFPDCLAQRLISPGVWQHVTIEFEFESRGFRNHAHPPDGCDFIVCWHHNWPDCPKNIEVIALDEAIKRLAPPAVL